MLFGQHTIFHVRTLGIVGSNQKTFNLYNLPKIIRHHENSQTACKFSSTKIFFRVPEMFGQKWDFSSIFSGRLNAHNFGASGFFPSAQNFWAEMKISNLYNLCREPQIFKTAQIFSSIWKNILLNIFEHQNFPSYQKF